MKRHSDWPQFLVEVRSRMTDLWIEYEVPPGVANPGTSRMWMSPKLAFIVSLEMHSGAVWIHASVSRRDKRLVFGPARQALEIHPPSDEHVNLVEARHLWGTLEGFAIEDKGITG